jgi:hypothetical protein
LVYAAYHARGVVAAIAAFLFMSFCYGGGAAFMFVVASSFLCFLFHAVGLWLPISSYVAGGITLFITIGLDRPQRNLQP